MMYNVDYHNIALSLNRRSQDKESKIMSLKKQYKIFLISLLIAGIALYIPVLWLPNQNIAFFIGMTVFTALYFTVCAVLKPYFALLFAVLVPSVSFLLFRDIPLALPIAAALLNLLILAVIVLMLRQLQLGTVISVISAMMIRFALMHLFIRYLLPRLMELNFALSEKITGIYAIPHLGALLLGSFLAVFLIPAYNIVLRQSE